MSSSSSANIQLKDYYLSERIGSGTYGEVFKGCRKTGTREAVAVKVVLKSKLDSREIDNLIQEISLLKKLKNPHIVEMKEFLWDKNYIYIVMEYCNGGDLSKFIKMRKSLDENICKSFLQQLALALKFLRSENISHMDLKPQNILISYTKTLKLADFGFAKKLSGHESALIGSPLYMAPEIILDRRYDAKVDLWSVGVILFECLFGKAPYKSESVDELIQKIKIGQPIVIPRQPHISIECRDLLQRLLERDPNLRIDFEDFFKHSFLDLDHAPTVDNYSKALNLIEKAVEADKNCEYEKALHLYREALDYFVPLYHAEMNPSKKSTLRKRIDEYINRAETIKLNSPSNSLDQESAANLLERKSSSNKKYSSIDYDFDELVELSKNCTNLSTGLEIANSAEMYEREGQYKLALEKYETGLGILIPLLSSEPTGKSRRKELLKSYLNKWMTRAEITKKILSLQSDDLENSISVTEDTKNCTIQ